jgi:hypothetical protein
VLSDEHRAALEQGRAEARVVREYLSAPRTSRPTRGRRRTVASITARLATIEAKLESAAANPIIELQLRQEQCDLTAERAAFGEQPDLSALVDEFVTVARSYSDRKGISYATWREVGVPAATLKRAGITRGVD